jgi:hypothetical protein
MPANDREVFKYFREQKNTTREIYHLAYASYARAKYDWMDHFEKLYGKSPDLEEENTWIADLPESRFDEFTTGAFEFFEVAARAYMATEIEEERKDAINTSILAQIEKATSFGTTFFPNLVIGLSASLLFAVLLIILGSIFNKDPSPIALFKSLEPVTHDATGPPTAPHQAPGP